MTTIAKATVIATAALSLLSATSCRKQPTASFPPPSKAKIATVDMQKLFTGYYKTTEVQKEINVERAVIQKENNDRIVRIRELETELKKLKIPLEDPSITTEKAELYKNYDAKFQEGVQMDRERREALQVSNLQLNERVVQRMKDIFQEFRTQLVIYAQTENYDYVSSDSPLSSHETLLAYTGDGGNATDITAIMLNIINKDAPADFQQPEGSKAAGTPASTSNSERNAASPPPTLRIAKVDMAKLVSMYYKNAENKKLMEEETEAIKKKDEEHQAVIRTIEARIQESQKQLDSATTDESLRNSLLQVIKRDQQEVEAQERERTEYSKRRNEALQEVTRKRTQPIVEEIRKIVIEQCKADGFDYVADRIPEASTSDGSFLLSTFPMPDSLGAMTDVTDIMLQEINKNAPAGFKPSHE